MAIGINLGNDDDEDLGPLSHWKEDLDDMYEPAISHFKSDSNELSFYEPSISRFRSEDENELIQSISHKRNAHNNIQHERKILDNPIKEKKKRYLYRG